MIKNTIRRLLRSVGYTIRSVGSPNEPSGEDMLHDVNVMLGKPKAPVLLDVGANIGQTIDAFHLAFDSPRIIAFEPSPRTFAALRQTHSHKAELHNLAMGERCGTMPFHVTAKHSVNDSLLPMPGADSTIVEVQVRTIDDFGLDRIDFLKIDTQGYDLNVLRGASRMLAERRIRAFCAELIFHEMYVGQPAFTELLEFARGTGYECLGFYDMNYLSGHLSSCDVCFVCRHQFTPKQ